MKSDIIAQFRIRDAGSMTPDGREHIALWLIRQANQLIEEGDLYTRGVFKASWHVFKPESA